MSKDNPAVHNLLHAAKRMLAHTKGMKNHRCQAIATELEKAVHECESKLLILKPNTSTSTKTNTSTKTKSIKSIKSKSLSSIFQSLNKSSSPHDALAIQCTVIHAAEIMPFTLLPTA